MSVSEFALGAMMFGAIGNTDHDEAVRVIHPALDAGINFVDTADRPATTSIQQTTTSPRHGRSRTSACAAADLVSEVFGITPIFSATLGPSRASSSKPFISQDTPNARTATD
jgi:hypothetical protein